MLFFTPQIVPVRRGGSHAAGPLFDKSGLT